MSEWREVRLGDLGEVNRGRSRHRPRNAPHLYGGPYPFIQTGDIKAANGLITTHSQTYSEAGLAQSRLWPEGTMVITIAANIAETAILTYPACFPDSVVGFVVDPSRADVRFIEYLFRHHKQQIQHENVGTGSVQDNINLQTFDRLTLRVPSLSGQCRIASLLGALDDKIELNRRMNETLEAMARLIFKDWFVDFGPTRAKAEGRAPYLAPELWDLFPDVLDDEDKPIGWTRERIGNHVLVKKGLSYKGAGLKDEAYGIPLHNLNSVLEGGGYKNDGLKFYSGDYKPRHVVQPGDLIVANTEQGFDYLLIGYSALIPAWVGKEGLFSHHLFKVEPHPASPLSRVWLHFALSASWFGEAIRRYSNGTTVNMLPQDAFEIPEIIVPPSGLVRAFDEFVEPKLRRQEYAVGESRTLAQTRDLLLPKLMSGQIRLAEAEKAVEAVA